MSKENAPVPLNCKGKNQQEFQDRMTDKCGGKEKLAGESVTKLAIEEKTDDFDEQFAKLKLAVDVALASQNLADFETEHPKFADAITDKEWQEWKDDKEIPENAE